MEILGKIFGSEARARVLRLFFFSPDISFEIKDIAKKTKTGLKVVRKELALLHTVGIIKRNNFYIDIPGKKSRKLSRKKIAGWCLDKTFNYGEQLKNLLISMDLTTKSNITNRFKNAGKVKLVVISGIFIKDEASRLDILIVGDKLKRGSIERILHSLEAEVGKELRYSVLDTPEFLYRMDIYDRFVRDILDYPHEVVIDKLGFKLA